MAGHFRLGRREEGAEEGKKAVTPFWRQNGCLSCVAVDVARASCPWAVKRLAESGERRLLKKGVEAAKNPGRMPKPRFAGAGRPEALFRARLRTAGIPAIGHVAFDAPGSRLMRRR